MRFSPRYFGLSLQLGLPTFQAPPSWIEERPDAVGRAATLSLHVAEYREQGRRGVKRAGGRTAPLEGKQVVREPLVEKGSGTALAKPFDCGRARHAEPVENEAGQQG